MINLILQYFKVKRSKSDKDYELLCKRQEEYTYCLKKNLEYKFIEKIHLLIENNEDIDELKKNINIANEKLVIFRLNKRMYYKDAFEYANKFLNEKIVIVLHTDIYLLSGFDKIKLKHLNNKLYALARTNNIDGKNTGRGIRVITIDNNKYCSTFDGWCFKTPLPIGLTNSVNQQQNVWGSENRLIYFFKKFNYDVTTPECLKMVHWHMTDIRPSQNWNWIKIDGTLISNEDHQKWRKNNKLTRKKLVGANIPIKDGTSLMTNDL